MRRALEVLLGVGLVTLLVVFVGVLLVAATLLGSWLVTQARGWCWLAGAR